MPKILDQVINLIDDENLTAQDMLTLKACLRIEESELTAEGKQIVDQCIQEVRNRILQFSEEELDFFDFD